MPDPATTTLTFWQLVLIAVVPGSIAAFVAPIGPALLERQKYKNETYKRSVDRLEKIVDMVCQHDAWIEGYKRRSLWGENTPETSNPIDPVRSLVALYHPALMHTFLRLHSATLELMQWFLAAEKHRTEHGKLPPLDGYNAVYLSYRQAFVGFLDLAGIHGGQLVGAARPSRLSRLQNWLSVKINRR